MDTDLMLVVGLFVGVLAVPSIASAFSEGRAPRAGAVLVLISGTLIVLALSRKPGGYTVDEIPKTIYSVIGRLLN
ncbi:hypothetical protein RNZ50_20000 [Paracoccaceae bacterium Fryx2]|nr:hypothetical protein [Paracoccaceae bacterium Fryx2]